MIFNSQFSNFKRKIRYNSGVKHIKFVDERPLTVSEMYRRAIAGIPLSVPKPFSDKIPLNDSFYSDDFDVLDLAIQNSLKIEQEAKLKALEESKRLKEEHREFLKWKEEVKRSKPQDEMN